MPVPCTHVQNKSKCTAEHWDLPVGYEYLRLTEGSTFDAMIPDRFGVMYWELARVQEIDYMTGKLKLWIYTIGRLRLYQYQGPVFVNIKDYTRFRPAGVMTDKDK